jgi:geranylgeranyl diphosphate synthase type II
MALRSFGENIGIGFQLKDDLLDVYADKKKFGKQVGGDIIANKKTFLLITALAKAKGKTKADLNRWLKAKKFDKRKKVKAVTEIYSQLKIDEITSRKIDQYFEKGFAELEKVQGGLKKDALVAFTKDLINRQA